MFTGKRFLVLLTLVLVLLLSACPAFASSPVAEMGGAVYDSLQNAFDAAVPGTPATVKLLSSFQTGSSFVIEKGQDITLDMNGHSITVTSNFEGRPIFNYGTLVITGNGVIDASASDTDGYGAVDNYGVLTIENGTFTGSVNASGASIKNRPGSDLTIRDGLFNGAVTAVYNAGTARIYNGTFDCRSCSSCNPNSWGYTIQSHEDAPGYAPSLTFYNGTVIGVQGAFSSSAGHTDIYDGSFKTVSCKNHRNGSTAFYALYVAGESGEVECNVYGGTFQSASKVAALIGNNTQGDGGDRKAAVANFYGGTFRSGDKTTALKVDGVIGSLAISGGSYFLSNGTPATTEVKDYLVPGFEQNPDGSVACTHASIAEMPGKAPTCTEPGSLACWHCSACGKYFSDASLAHELSQEQLVIPPTGHRFEDGVCTVCGAADPGYVPPAAALPPKTGDATPLWLWAALLALSGAGLIAAVSRRSPYQSR